MDTAKLQKLNIVLQRLYKMGAPKAGHHKLIGWVDNRFFKKKNQKTTFIKYGRRSTAPDFLKHSGWVSTVSPKGFWD